MQRNTSAARRGRLGGLTTAALYDGRVITQKARDTYRASFSRGHACAVCPQIDLPADLPDTERERRGEFLRRLHFARMSARRKAA